MKIIPAFGATIVLLTATFASAHGLATTKSELVGNYLVQLEYDTLGNINAGDNTSFSFELLNPDTKESVDFDRVFVRIVKKNGPLAFSSNLAAIEGFAVRSARANIYVPVEGEYKIELNYYKSDQELVKHTFEIPVDPPYVFNENTNPSSKLQFLVSLVLGAIIGVFIYKFINDIRQKKS